VGRPRAHDYDELRQALLEVTARVLAEEGPHALSTRRLARDVGTSTTAVYSLFGDKAGLIRAVFLEGFARLARALTAIPLTDDPVADLIAMGHAYRANARGNPHLYELMFGRPIPGFTPDPETVKETLQAFQPLIDAVTRTVEAGVLAAAPLEIAIHLHALVHGLTSLELHNALHTDPDQQWQASLRAGVDAYRPLQNRASPPEAARPQRP
jgi:AcrR family transcriptional regulator